MADGRGGTGSPLQEPGLSPGRRSASSTESGKLIVQYLSFSDNGGSFVAGVNRGFTVHESTTKTIGASMGGGVHLAKIVESDAEYIIFVGDGTSPHRPKNKVLMWKQSEEDVIIELAFRSDVLGLAVSKERIVVVTMTQLNIYSFESEPKPITTIDTGRNPKGLCVLSKTRSRPIIAFPSRDDGSLQITDLVKSDGVTIAAHSNPLCCLALSSDARQIATASLKGTCIRIFDTSTGDVLRELRRGVDQALIRCLAFSPDTTRLLVASDKRTHSTIHMFSLTKNDGSKNKHSRLYGLRGVLPTVFSSEWSSCQYRCSTPQSICAFGPNRDTFTVVGFNGMVYVCMVDATAKNGCRLLTTSSFL